MDRNGYSALMWSAAYGQNNAVLLLLEKGADVQLRGKRLETALHLAAAGGHQEVIRLLIAFGADPDIFDEVSICISSYLPASGRTFLYKIYMCNWTCIK